MLDGYKTSCCFEFVRQDADSRSYVAYLFLIGFGIPVGSLCKLLPIVSSR